MIKINWKLYSNNNLIIDLKNVKCNKDNNKLIININDEINTIDLNKKIFIRELKDYNMSIDFINKIITFKLNDGKVLDFDIDCSININDNEVIMNYNLDENKKIIVERI